MDKPMARKKIQSKDAVAIGKSQGRGPLCFFIDQYRDYAFAKGLAAGTVKAVRHDVAKLSKWMTAKKIRSLTDLGPKRLQAFQLWLGRAKFGIQSQPRSRLSSSSKAKVIANLRSFLAWAYHAEHTATDLSKCLPIPKTPKPLPRDIPTLQRIATLIRRQPYKRDRSGTHRRNVAIIATLFACGLRRQECAGLLVDDFSHDDREVRVRIGKGQHGRTVPIAPWARDLLADYLRRGRPRLETEASEGRLFLRDNGKPMTGDDVGLVMQEVCRRAKVSPVVQAHTLRHAFCYYLLKGGCSSRIVQEAAGHRKYAATARYLKMTTKDLAKVVKKSHPRGR